MPNSLRVNGVRLPLWCCLAVLAVASVARAVDAQNPPPTPPPVQNPPGQSSAQRAASAAAGRVVTNQEIADSIRRSGLSEAQVRQRLQLAGYDPSLADPFFSQSGRAGDAQGQASAAFIAALQEIGLYRGRDAQQNETTASERADAPTAPRERTVFGQSVFGGRSTLFDPIASGPVDASYRLGAGDQLQVILTGEVEAAYTQDVRRDGTVVLPQIGQVTVAGLTVDAARTLLKQRAGRVYSGIASGGTGLDLALGRIRTIVVFVSGDVEEPGAHQVNALATVFHAIARAGGPASRGSFRQIELRRGGTVIRRFDLYDYLLRGDASNDTRLEQGDIVFVPLSSRLVAIEGAVRRPGVFELRPNEGFAELLTFAGGLLPTASTDRLLIDRVLPPAQREPGKDRALINAPFDGDVSRLAPVPLFDNDAITAFRIGDLRRNSVTVLGEVFQPGQYEWRATLTLGDVINQAQGATPWALRDRVKVVRSIPQTGRKEFFSLNLDEPAALTFRISEFDEVTVLDGRLAYPQGTILVEGAVNVPGERKHVERMTLGDAIDLAGGFAEFAASVEVARRVVRADYTDTTAVVRQYALDARRALEAAAAGFLIERGDQISVRIAPGRRQFGTVTVSGNFTYPGVYAIQHETERLRDLIERVGGVLPNAYARSFRLVRGGRNVSVRLAQVMAGEADDNVVIRDNDEVVISTDPAIVLVSGAVERQVAVPYRPGWGVGDYVGAAGGIAPDGDRGKIVVEGPAGEIARTTRFLWFENDPSVLSGSTITVLRKPASTGGGFRDALTSTLQIASTLASLAIAYIAVSDR